MLRLLRTAILCATVCDLSVARRTLHGAASAIPCLLRLDIKGVNQRQDKRGRICSATGTLVLRLSNSPKRPRMLGVDVSTMRARGSLTQAAPRGPTTADVPCATVTGDIGLALRTDHCGNSVHVPTDERDPPRGNEDLIRLLLLGALSGIEGSMRPGTDHPLLPSPFELRQLPGLNLAIRRQEVGDTPSQRPLSTMVASRGSWRKMWFGTISGMLAAALRLVVIRIRRPARHAVAATSST